MRRLLIGSDPRRTALRAAVLVAAAVILFRVVLLPVRLIGISMEPSYRDGAFNFANRLAFAWREPARGEVVAIRMAGPGVLYVKRVVGLPGERVEIENGIVKIDDAPLDEPDVVGRAPWRMAPVLLGPDQYFVIGDNRAMTMEQHDFGRVARERLVGPLLF